ncbi:MAG: hypothetical protein Q4P34_02065 [Tissierellia bacterium]|nr:hypothetical protein [Tissierellia bacterium]
MSISENIKKYFLYLPMCGITASVLVLIFFMLNKRPSSAEAIAYALLPTVINTIVSIIVISIYLIKKKIDLNKEFKEIKSTTGIMMLSLPIFIAVYSIFF